MQLIKIEVNILGREASKIASRKSHILHAITNIRLVILSNFCQTNTKSLDRSKYVDS